MVNPPVSLNLVLCATISVLLLLLSNEMTSSADKIVSVGVKMCCLICKRHGSCKSTSYDAESLVCDTDSKQREGESFEDFCKDNEMPDVCWKNQCGRNRQCLTTPRNEARCVPVIPKESSHSKDHEPNRRSYNKSVSEWSSRLSIVNSGEFMGIAVVKGLIIIFDSAHYDITSYSVNNQTLKIACRLQEGLGVLPFAIHKFGDNILIQYENKKTLSVFNVDFNSITVYYTLITNVSYTFLAVADNSTIVAINVQSQILHILTINGNVVTSCRNLTINRSQIPTLFFWRLSVTHDLDSIILTDLGQNIICLDQNGNMKWNVSNSRFKNVVSIHTDNHGNIFVLDSYAKNVFHLKQTGEYLKIIIPKFPPLQTPNNIVVDENGTLYVLTKEQNVATYVHVYVFN